VRFVNIIYSSWDHHSNLDSELPYNTGAVDQPIAALIKDLKQRGMLDETLVVRGTEFGRTPLGENRGGSKNVTGRDHYPFAFTMFLAGGGLRGRQIYEASDEIGWSVVEKPWRKLPACGVTICRKLEAYATEEPDRPLPSARGALCRNRLSSKNQIRGGNATIAPGGAA
jgi:hypothetical protein